MIMKKALSLVVEKLIESMLHEGYYDASSLITLWANTKETEALGKALRELRWATSEELHYEQLLKELTLREELLGLSCS